MFSLSLLTDGVIRFDWADKDVNFGSSNISKTKLLKLILKANYDVCKRSRS